VFRGGASSSGRLAARARSVVTAWATIVVESVGARGTRASSRGARLGRTGTVVGTWGGVVATRATIVSGRTPSR
ncbi:MAG: hypothetical protein KGL79_07845, partial [Acidobacteriota bacterium]|nr:hypothetical protein [Acidobacteriota bacterium]